MKVLIINGPNLSRLGTREPEIYGSMTHPQLVEKCISWGNELGIEVEVRQSDAEAQIVSWLEEASATSMPVVINPAAFTHYSYPIAEACKKNPAGVIEVHISNPHAREEFRTKSVISPAAKGTIAGFGADSYKLALISLKGN
ncbi:MAG: type 3-dehydroquinate dehydratase [Actinomycetota bacterium]|jgi:3-dehydroquinate dehydratase-2